MAEIQVIRVEWSETAGQVLADAVPFGTPADLERQVREEGAQLFEVIAEGGRVGFYLLRIDRSAVGCEGVLVAGAGALQGVDLIATLIPIIEKQFRGCAAMRVHTARPGLARKLARQGYGAGEIVLRKNLC
jgi:hypothetical protein